jgi:hypothetical protein
MTMVVLVLGYLDHCSHRPHGVNDPQARYLN